MQGPNTKTLKRRQAVADWSDGYTTYLSPVPSENGPSAPYFWRYQNVYEGTFVGYKNPRWKEQIRNEQNATTAYTWDVESYRNLSEGEDNWALIKKKGYNYTQTGHYTEIWGRGYGGQWANSAKYGGHLTNSAKETSADNEAKSRFLARVRADYQHFSAGVFSGELRETLRQLSRPYAGIQKLMGDYLRKLALGKQGVYAKHLTTRRVKRIRSRAAERAANHELDKILADTWLETTFGLLPLLSDARSAAEALARYVNGDEIVRRKVRGSGARYATEEGHYKDYSSYCRGELTCDADWLVREEVRVTYNGGLRTRMYGAGNLQRDWIDLVGLGPRDFVPTAWNLLPWSWLVDYFSNVGDVLEAQWTYTGDVTWVSKTVSRQKKSLWAEVPNYKLPRMYPSSYLSFGAPSYVHRSISERRSGSRSAVSPSSLIPTLELKFEPGESVTKAGNLLAVFSKSLSKLQPFRF